MRGHSLVWINSQTLLDEVAGCKRDVAPVFSRGEGVVGDEDGLHFLEIAVSVERSVAT